MSEEGIENEIVNETEEQNEAENQVEVKVDALPEDEINAKKDAAATDEIIAEEDAAATDEINAEDDAAATDEIIAKEDAAATDEIIAEEDAAATDEIIAKEDAAATDEIIAKEDAAATDESTAKENVAATDEITTKEDTEEIIMNAEVLENEQNEENIQITKDTDKNLQDTQNGELVTHNEEEFPLGDEQVAADIFETLPPIEANIPGEKHFEQSAPEDVAPKVDIQEEEQLTENQEGGEEAGLEEVEDKDVPPDEKEIEIEIPDLYGDDADSLPDLGDTAVKKGVKEEPEQEHLDLGTKSGDEELGAEEDFGSEEFEEFAYEEEEAITEKVVRDRPAKRVEIGGPEYQSSESDILLQLIEREGSAEVSKEKEKEPEDPYEASGVHELLNSVLLQAIKKSEEIDPDAVLRMKLDKNKVMIAFKNAISDTQQERQKGYFLVKKVIEYFRKKKYYRALVDDNPDTILETMSRYRQSLKRLDHVKAQENSLQLQVKTKLDELQREGSKLQESADAKLEALNKRLKEIGISTASVKTGQHMSEKYVDVMIKRMNALRDKISQFRLTFIKAQHKMASLLVEAKKLEDIGDGLKVIDFEQLRAETQGLGDKVEERNNELSKLRERCTADTHLLAHIREKQCMLNHTITLQDDILYGLKDELNTNRNYVNKLKLERDSIRKKYNEMSYECGLLDKPNLLHDFDDTVEQINEVKGRVNDLKETKAKMLNELAHIQIELEKKS